MSGQFIQPLKVDASLQDKIVEAAENIPPRRKEIADNWLTNGFNASKAARDAGVAENHASVEGCRVLANDKVKDYVDLMKEEAVRSGDITPEFITACLVKEIREGDTAGARVRAAELLGRAMPVPMFTDKVQTKEIVDDDDLANQLEALADVEADSSAAQSLRDKAERLRG